MPAGQRVYAIGDIHGRLDLLDELLARIDDDGATRGEAETELIFLGDLIDRGPQSAQVVERLRMLSHGRAGLRFLLGNHEEMFLDALAGDFGMLRVFCRVGGRETALSYGIDPDRYERLDYEQLLDELVARVPAEHCAFLRGFEDVVIAGDYAFVHAGIRPGIALADQRPSDLRWIREPFLAHRGPFEKVIVHGHTIAEEVVSRPCRIGLDTGAFATGRLSALGLEGARRWTLQT